MNSFNIFEMMREWRNAYRAHDIEQFFRTITPSGSGKSESIPIANLGSRCVGIALHGSITLTASAAQAVVSGAKIIDLLDNIVLTDASGKTRMNIKPRTLYNICGAFMDKTPTMDNLTNFSGAGSATFTFDIVIPVSISADEGIYHLQIDYAITNCYAANVVVASSSTIDIVGIYSDSALPAFKITDITKAIVSGNNMITELEANRVWYGVLIQGVSALSNIDDITLKSGNFDLISAEYPDIYKQFLYKINYTPHSTGDCLLSFRPHTHLTTDFFNIEGTTTATLTIAVIAQADEPIRTATPAEVRAPAIVAQATATPKPSVMTGTTTLPVAPKTPFVASFGRID